ncbi:MAG: hypothetical protein BHV65_15985 [Alistipes sp. 58_9_plus]|nr:MAG: hypothetical protein BHV65_15985 [Alistipes sp. 58_9_plus]
MNSTNCERAGLDVFGFECVAGSFDDFIGPYTAVISETAAKRCGLGVGDVLHSGRGATEGSHTLTVVAIYRDFPEPSSVAKNDMYMGMIPLEQHDRSNWNDPFYLRLKPGTSPEAVEKKMADHWREQAANEGYTQEEIEREIAGNAPRLNNVCDIYFSRDTEGNDGPTGNITTTYTLLSIAVLIIVIAFINFINFFFALIPVRIRAVNTRKIFGASNARLRMGFVAETVGLFVVGLAVGYGLVVIFNDTQMASYLSTSAAIGKNLPLALGFVAVAVVAGILISLYPIFYITSFSPAFVIKGSFQATRSGRVLRYTLVGVQYVISISLIIVTLFIQSWPSTVPRLPATSRWTPFRTSSARTRWLPTSHSALATSWRRSAWVGDARSGTSGSRSRAIPLRGTSSTSWVSRLSRGATSRRMTTSVQTASSSSTRAPSGPSSLPSTTS